MGNFFSSAPAEHWKSDAQYAMESGTYCVVCGNPFDIEGDVYNTDPKDPRFRWLNEFRLLGSVEAGQSHVVICEDSTPLNVSGTHGIFLSEPAAYSLSGSHFIQVPGHDGPRDVWYESMSRQSFGDTLFALHDACLDICRRAVFDYQMKHTDIVVEPDLTVLTRLLNMRLQYRHLRADVQDEVKNDLFNLCATSEMYGPQSVLAMSRLEWWGGLFEKFYTDPTAVSDTSSFVSEVLRASPRVSGVQPRLLAVTRPPESLEQLPAELIDLICDYLPVQSIISIHRTSKALHNLTPLDNTFWRDNLRKGRLYPHIRNLDTRWIENQLKMPIVGPKSPAASWDWRGIAELLATKRFPIHQQDWRLQHMPNEYWNRCRIWSVVEETIATDSQILFRPKVKS